MRDASSVKVRLLAVLAVSMFAGAGCSDGGGDEPVAGGPPAPMMVGDPCVGGDCPIGTVCATSGRLAGQCTVTCNGDMGCLLFGARVQCNAGQCGVTCASNTDCVEGTLCAPAGTRAFCER